MLTYLDHAKQAQFLREWRKALQTPSEPHARQELAQSINSHGGYGHGFQTPAQIQGQDRFARVSGNFLEMYDFIVYGYYASSIAKTYFPGGSEFASLMLSFVTFGAGFLMRPLGAIVLGAYIDQHGRRKG